MSQQQLDLDGFTVIKEFFDEKDFHPIREDLVSLLRAFYRGCNLDFDFAQMLPNEIDRMMVTLLFKRPDLKSVFYDRLQQMPALLALPNHSKIRKIGSDILDTNALGVWPRVQMRFDSYQDEKNLIEWHHDYLYNQGTSQSYTFWIPLVNTEADMGELQVARGSHRCSSPIKFIQSSRNNRFNFSVDSSDLRQFEILRPSLKVGDCLILNGLTLHSGALNDNKERARLTILFRIQNLNRLDCFTRQELKHD